MKAYQKINRIVIKDDMKLDETGSPAVVIALPEASAYLVFDKPEELSRFARQIDQAAAKLLRDKGSKHFPLVLPSKERKLDAMVKAGALKV